jgi:hypothetical protein
MRQICYCCGDSFEETETLEDAAKRLGKKTSELVATCQACEKLLEKYHAGYKLAPEDQPLADKILAYRERQELH